MITYEQSMQERNVINAALAWYRANQRLTQKTDRNRNGKMGRPKKALPQGMSASEHEIKRRALGYSMRRYAIRIGMAQATYIKKVNEKS